MLTLKLDKFSKQNNINRNKFVILLPGRLTPWKGQKIFIEAIKLLSDQKDDPPFEAIILGSDQGRNVYKKKLVGLVQQYRLGKIIKFIEKCEEMPVAYGIANLVCSCSYEPEQTKLAIPYATGISSHFSINLIILPSLYCCTKPTNFFL
jgi:glycosyltransferase involved in cell wall biosynthesis